MTRHYAERITKIFDNFRIGARLGLGFGITLAFLCLIGGLATLQAARVYEGTGQLATKWLPSVQTLGELRSSVNIVRRTTQGAILATDPKDRQAQRMHHDNAIPKLASALERYEKSVSSPEDRQLINSFKATWETYMVFDREIHTLSEQGDKGFNDARALIAGESLDAFFNATNIIEKEIELNRRGAEDAGAEAASNFHKALSLTCILTLVALAISAAVAVMITRSITIPIRQAVAVAETVAHGDLTSIIYAPGKDETSQLLRALKHMNERLVDLVGRVRTSSESIATGSAQIATGNTDLSQRTEEQAASLEETAASMEELTAMVKQNTENARQGSSLAATASEVAASGGDVVAKVVDTMQAISSSSSKVAEIIAVIEGIAFQTNILALNAAVEAARAGEHGRGFAVVAGEVRTLAQRSATAAKEIKDLIGNSVEKVSIGSQLVDQAGQTMREVIHSVRRVTDLMGEITSASVEQHVGIEQVNKAVIQMDETTQQNAALVEEASAASQSMAVQSSSLRELVSIFKLH